MYANKERFIIVNRVGRYITYGDYHKFHRHQTTNKYATIGQWVVKDEKEYIDVREPILTRVENMKVQLKVQILGINKDGSLKTSHFKKVRRGVIDGSGLNDNQLINRFVVVEFFFLTLRFNARNAEWRVILILDQEKMFNITGLLYAEEKNTYRIHSKDFPLDFKISRNFSNKVLKLGSSLEFDFPDDGVYVESYRILSNKQPYVSVDNKKVVLQDSYHLNYKTNSMNLDHTHNVFDVSFSLQVYMRGLDLQVVNAWFRLTPYDADRVYYILEPHQPFMESKSDGFDLRSQEVMDQSPRENEDNVYSDEANSYGYASNSRSTTNNNYYGAYSDVIDDDDDESEPSSFRDDRECKEAKVVARIEQCKELIVTAEDLISALSSISIGARIEREAKHIRRNLQCLSRDHGVLHPQMKYKDLKKEKQRLNDLIKQYEEAIREGVLFLVEHDLVDQKETAQLVICCYIADNI